MSGLEVGTQNSQSEISIAEMRMESVRAGLLGAGAVMIASGLAWAVLITVNVIFADSDSVQAIALPIASTLVEWLVNLAVAICSGFFFGVTYRYIVRQDDNLHLGSGAVGAFAFVRSLAQIEALWTDTFALHLWLLITGESFLWFAAARYTLDWAIEKNWIKPLD